MSSEENMRELLHLIGARRIGDRPAGLTSREEEVAKLVALGVANKQIAAVLNLSIKTVEKHRHVVYDKVSLAIGFRVDCGVILAHWCLGKKMIRNMFEAPP